MFRKKKEDAIKGEQKAGAINIVGVGTQIKGDLETSGDIRIDGKITGNLLSKAKVVIGQTGEVNGNIHSDSAEVSGLVNGNISSSETLYLKATAQVNGDIVSNKLVVENGANFTGHCQTGLSQTKSISEKKKIFDVRAERQEATA
ncbi:bactofilin family protein [Pedobacter glucosidilyticus]|uniref:bactofilin family protein n=1 Tax=Pedobacter glucosidilyticus TaxID=1122941 RepID=UPI0004174F66|nr:polymer-forming cytoskeletal protein [Pedobacter glucosidilyticus]